MRKILGWLEPCLFYLFIFAIPFEKRLIVARWVYPFNEWTSAYIYGTDILILLLFVFWAVRVFSAECKGHPYRAVAEEFRPGLKNPNLWLAGFFIVSAVSIFSSRIAGLSFYQLSKLAEFAALYFYLKNNLGKVFGFRMTLTVVIGSGLFQAVIAIMQFLKQSSLGLRVLGESPLSINGTGVAVFIADSQKYLRAYGATPHPNVLAAWLFLALFAFYNFYFYQPKAENSSQTRKIAEGIGLLGYAVMLFGFFFTFSRVVIALWFLGVAARMSLLFFKNDFAEFLASTKRRLVKISAVTLAVAAIVAIVYWPLVRTRIRISAEEEAVTQRIFYNQIAGSVATSHPVFGIGIGQFVPDMMNKFKHLPANLYQPAHNIYLLIASETGFLGLALFLLFLFFVFYNFASKTGLRSPYHFYFFILVLSFLLMGLFDHFLWTLQQGSLILWIALALIGSRHFLKTKDETEGLLISN